MAPEQTTRDTAPPLSASWVTTILRQRGVLGQAAHVRTVTQTPLAPGQGMTGRVLRLSMEYDSEEPEAPRSLIAKLSPQEGPTRELAKRFRLYEREARFYEELAESTSMPTPRLYDVARLSPDDYIILLEDIRDATPGDLLRGCSLEQAKTIVHSLAQMHASWWGSPKLDDAAWLPSPDDPATLEYAKSIARPAWTRFRRRVGDHLPPELVTLGRRMSGGQSVLGRLGAAPRTLVHGDLRINNVLFQSSDDRRLSSLIDWQTVGRGRGPIDIASLFVSSLQPDDRRIAEDELLPGYHKLLLDGGVKGYSYDQCWTDYRLAVIEQFGQVIVLSHLLDVASQMPDEVTAATATRMFSALLDLDLIDLLPDQSAWSRLRSLLPV